MAESTKKLMAEAIDGLSSLPGYFFPDIPLQGRTIELSLRFVLDDASVRNFGGYLTYLDRAYGRMFPLGLRSYSRRPEEQLKVVKAREGSLELVIRELVCSLPDAIPIFVLYLLLQTLPSMLRKLAGAYREFQEGRLVKMQRTILYTTTESQKGRTEALSEPQRKQVEDLIEASLSRHQLMQKLRDMERDSLVSLLEELLRYDPSLQKTAIEFSTANVKEVTIRLVQETPPNHAHSERALVSRR